MTPLLGWAMIPVLFVTALAASPAPVAPPAAACPRERVRVIEESSVVFPANAHPTHGRVRFLLDLGSDGRIRRVAIVESSGDPMVDAVAEKALAQFRYAPPSAGCMSASTVTSQYWDIPPEALAPPAPAEVTASPAPLQCAAPFVRPARFPGSAHPVAAGTVGVDVSLDATARVTAIHLAQSSGNKKTDYAATIAARNGTYVFERQPGCPTAATTYRFELTFH